MGQAFRLRTLMHIGNDQLVQSGESNFVISLPQEQLEMSIFQVFLMQILQFGVGHVVTFLVVGVL